MAKKSGGVGLFALAAGLAAGATAIFFSDKKNRTMVKKEVMKVEKEAVKLTKEAKKNPQKFAKKVQGNAKRSVAKASKQVKSAEKKVAKKVSSSPALRAVGKKAKKK
ncbi:hypothetical protein BH10PAT2_BH10PAT2_2430 [soil metagenome]